MDENRESVMVALLPITTYWSVLDLPHLTLVYAGKIPDLKPTDFNEMGKVASDVSQKHRPLQLMVTGFEVFGEGLEKVEVYTLKNTAELMAIQRRFADWSVSQYPFNPHVTIGPVGTVIGDTQVPPAIAFDRITVRWGDAQNLTFWLNPKI